MDTILNIEIKNEYTNVIISDKIIDWESQVIIGEDSVKAINRFCIGTNSFVEAVQSEFKIPDRIARPMITDRSYGNKVAKAMRKCYGDFAAELQRRMGYYQKNIDKEAALKKIILSGEGKDIIGLKKLVHQSLDLWSEKMEKDYVKESRNLRLKELESK